MRPGEKPTVVDIAVGSLPAVPDLPSRTGPSWWLAGLPALGSLGAVGFLALAPRSPFSYAAGALMILVSIGMVAGNYVRSRTERVQSRGEIRAQFLDDLDAARTAIRARDAQARESGSRVTITANELQLPVGTQQSAPPAQRITAGPRADPFCRQRLEQLVARTSVISDVPVRYAFTADTAICGPPARVRGLVRHVLRTIVLGLDPAELRIAVLTPKPHRWRALRWTPHHRHPVLVDRCGPARLVAADADTLTRLLSDLTTPVLLIADGEVASTDELEPHVRWTVRVNAGTGDPDLLLDDNGKLYGAPGGQPVDALIRSGAELDAACRRSAGEATRADKGPVAEGAADEPLRPILGTSGGAVVHLDIRESSRGGAGPHGMLIGVTGSGKSEVLRSVVAGLVSVHPPAELSLLLVDFKGGATFAPFERLPQTAAVITNLEDDPALVKRMQTALGAELRRRQQVLKAAGVASVEELSGAAAVPRLLVVIDEFSELLSAHPDALEVLVQVGRLGRSLGVHLLIAAQRLDEGRLKGLDSHLTYRIALRTQTAAESRSVLGSGVAAELANAPGHGFLRRGSAGPVEFRARFTGAVPPAAQPADGSPPAILHYVNGPLREASTVGTGPTILDAAIAAAPAHPGRRLPIWVPPPSRSPTHQVLYDDLAVRPGRGYGTQHGSATTAAVGLVDRPDLQRIDVALTDLAAGHLAIVGTTRSGATTAAQTVLLSLALRSTPTELNLYLVEGSAGGFRPLRQLPHTAAYAGADPERARAVVRRVASLVAERETVGGRRDGPLVVLAIDAYARFRDEHDELESVLLDITGRGLAVGVHVVLTAHRWLDLRARQRELFGNRIELRLGDPIESELDRRAAALVPRGVPGRGLSGTADPLYVARSDAAALVRRVEQAWAGPRARGLAELPPVLTIGNLSSDLTGQGLCVAVERSEGRAVILPDEAPFCLVIGDPGSGRTSVLRSLGLQDARRGTHLLVIDPRRRLLGDLPSEQVLGYAATPAAAAELLAGLAAGLERRMPAAEVTPHQLRGRSWWDGPQLHLMVDDYDVVTLIGTSLAPVRRFLPYAADIGLRVTIARRAAGAAAALHDETLSVLRDLGASALLLSRAVDEGSLLGARPGPAAWGTGVLSTSSRAAIDVQAITEPQR